MIKGGNDFQKQMNSCELGKLVLNQFCWLGCALCLSALWSATLLGQEDVKAYLVSGAREALSDSDPKVQLLATETLIELGIVDHLDQDRLTKLIESGYFDQSKEEWNAWNDEDYENRIRAINAISRLEESPVSLLCSLVSNGDLKIRHSVYSGLKRLGTDANSSTPCLFERLKKNDPEAVDVLLTRIFHRLF